MAETSDQPPVGGQGVVAIIPAFNEYTRLRQTVEQARPLVDAVVVIDDGSREPLAAHLPTLEGLTVLRHSVNLGKGAALTTGLQWATQAGFTIAVLLDADGQHNPAEIPDLIAPLQQQRADITFGVRSFHSGMPLVARVGNIVLTKMVSLLFHVHVTDTQSGYRALRLAIYERIAWTSSRYSVETEMIVNVGKQKIAHVEVPISTIYHDKYKGTTVIDGVRIFMNMIAWRFL
ncbi:MAG: glycosyltransferase family 2 protein [Candidatus Kerfeldbacteria bacterium]|nr:glycosyltransferase family 2 protein [Candidatus Kerfeldbacteria bacterium]